MIEILRGGAHAGECRSCGIHLRGKNVVGTRRAQHLWRLCLAAVGTLAGLQSDAAPAGEATCTALQPGPVRTVTRIVDGETLALHDGSVLRLIGALAPRAADAGGEPGNWPPEVAAKEQLAALVLGRSIELAFGGERMDRYGRWQAHAFLIDQDRRRWVQGHLLEQGLARAYALPGNRACIDELSGAERAGRDASRGVWGYAAYQLRQAADPAELLRYVATFQVIESRVVRVGQGRRHIYLNFGRDFRRSFSVSIPRGDRALLGDYAGRPKALEGVRVRVHGWLEARQGPLVDLSAGGQLEVVDTKADATDPSTPPEIGGSPSGGADHQTSKPDAKKPDAKLPGLVETGQ